MGGIPELNRKIIKLKKMNYQDYINLGFKRTDMNDNVEFRETGYYGYCLDKTINKKLSISVCARELEKPKLYIKKRNRESYHIIEITGEIVEDLLIKNANIDYMATAS